MSAYREVPANQSFLPSEYLRKAFLPEANQEVLFLAWPGKELEAAQFLAWWRESREKGCAMLPGPQGELLQKENRFWLALEVQPACRDPTGVGPCRSGWENCCYTAALSGGGDAAPISKVYLWRTLITVTAGDKRP